MDGEGVAVKDTWSGVVGGGGHWGIFPKTSQNTGCVKAKVFRRGERVLKVSPPLHPQKILIIHYEKSEFLFLKILEKASLSNKYPSPISAPSKMWKS